MLISETLEYIATATAELILWTFEDPILTYTGFVTILFTVLWYFFKR